MRAVYFLAGEPLGAEIRLGHAGLIPVGPGKWLKEVIANKPARLSDREYLYHLQRQHQGYLSVHIVEDRRWGRLEDPHSEDLSDVILLCR
jgi:hypothetical protein